MPHRFTRIVHGVLWVLIITLAFAMQVIPLLLIFTMFNMAVGISSGAVLIAVPVVLLCSLFLAFVFAERRRRNWRPSPVRVDEVRHQQMTRNRMVPGRGSSPARDVNRRWIF